MKRHGILASSALSAILVCAACNSSPGRPGPASEVIRPDKIMEFNVLYGQNCAGCHGQGGKGEAAIALGDPVYLAIADEATIRHVTTIGVPGTPMPAFAKSAGGMLTDEQIEALVRGIRSWARPDILLDAKPPPYSAQAPGDPRRGADVYATFCSGCHGPGGRGGQTASSIVNGSYLALVSDQ